MDLFIHENFFSDSEQLALVYDPLSGEDGLFVWHKGHAERHQYLVEEDTASETMGDSAAVTKTRLTAAAQARTEDLPARMAQLERRTHLLTWVVIAVSLLAVLWPAVALWWSQSDSVETPETPASIKTPVPLPRSGRATKNHPPQSQSEDNAAWQSAPDDSSRHVPPTNNNFATHAVHLE